MNITLASSFPPSKERGAKAKVSYEFTLDDPGKEVPLRVGWLALEEFFPPELINIANLGQRLPVQISRLGASSAGWRQPRPVTESFNIAAFEPEKLLEILQPGDEAIIGWAVQATINGQAVGDGEPLEKNLLVRHDYSLGSNYRIFDNRIKVAEVESPRDALERPNIFNVSGRTAGVIYPKSAYSPSEYFGWPTNVWNRNRRVGDYTLQIRHLGNDLFLGGKVNLEPVVETAVGSADVDENGTLVGYDLIAIGWGLGESGRREVQSQILQEFR